MDKAGRRRRAVVLLTGFAVLAALGIVILIVFRNDEKKYHLRWKLQMGQRLVYRQGYHSKFPSHEGESWDINSLTVESVDAQGTAALEYRVDRTFTRMKGALGDVDYDSARDPQPPDNKFARSATASVGRSIRFQMDPRGRSSEVVGMQEVMKATMEPLGMGSGGWILCAPGSLILPMEFPSEPVSVGDSWESTSETMGGGGRIHERIVLKRVSGGIACLEAEVVKREFRPIEGVKEPKAQDRTTVLFSLDKGVLLSLKREIQVDGTLMGGKPFGYTVAFETSLVEGR